MKKYIKTLDQAYKLWKRCWNRINDQWNKKFISKEKRRLGRAINKVKGKYLGKQLGSEIVQFGRSEKIETEISIGDMVLISTGYPLKSDLTGTVVEKGARFIKVAFEKSIPK